MSGTEKTVVSLGMFDGVHLGHSAVIRNASEEAKLRGAVSAAFTFSGAPDLPKFEGHRSVLLMSYEDKVCELRSAGAGHIFSEPFDGVCREMSPEDFFDTFITGKMNAVCVVCGEDFRFGKDRAGDTALLRKLCERAGIGFKTVAPVCVGGETISSSLIREKIRNGDIESAERLLGHGFYYTLPVIEGRRLGRTIGFPTANGEIPPWMVSPKRGVYAAEARIIGSDAHNPGTVYPAITNIGVKPTVKDDDAENMETHIIGFDGDIYGASLRVTLRSYMREERKFGGLGELKKQLEDDRNKAIRTFS